MARDILAALNTRRLVADGAMGTMLMAKGLPQGWCPEEWVESHPEEVKAIHRAYFEAGCDIVLTDTFGGSPLKLETYGYASKAAQWNRKAAELAREVAGEDRFVGGSIGPTGQFLPPLGTMTEEDAYDGFKVQAVALEAGGVDVIFVETMTVIEEIVLGVKAAKENTSRPVVATMTFDETRKGYRTMMGITPEVAVEKLQEAGADVVGTNCGAGPDLTVGVLRAMRAVTDGYLAGQPNAGLPTLQDGKNVYPMTPQEMVARMKPMLDLDVRIIGGCCGTNPDFMREIAAMVKGAA
jgi:5-methyltetrahydrofolate--homocysteine methyltransferase